MSLLTGRLPDSRKLRHVVAVARAGSFTGATKILAITQSALTKSVAEMEQQLGYPIFERLPRGVRLTDAGQTFVQRAEQLLTDMGDLMASMNEIADLQAGRLRLGVAPASFVTFLDKSLPAFARLYPGIEIELKTGTIDEMARALINREIDLCVGAINYLHNWRELKTVAIGQLDTFFIGRRNHPAGDHPDAITLLQYPVVLPATGLSTEVNLASAYHSAGMQPRSPHYICDHFPLALELVSKTAAISPVVTFGEPSDRFRNRFTVYENIIYLEAHELGYAIINRESLPPSATAFVNLYESMLSSRGQSLA